MSVSEKNKQAAKEIIEYCSKTVKPAVSCKPEGISEEEAVKHLLSGNQEKYMHC